MKKRWIIGPIIVGMLAVGVLTTGVILAQETDTEDSPITSLTTRVAAILGLDEDQVQDAVDQAITDMKNEAVQNRLDAMVEDGHITQEQANEYLEWYQARPEGLPYLLERGPHFGRHWHEKGFREFHEFHESQHSHSSGTISQSSQIKQTTLVETSTQ